MWWEGWEGVNLRGRRNWKCKGLRQEKLGFFTELKGWWNHECRGKGRKMKLCVMCLVTQSLPTLCVPIDCSLPGSSVLGLLYARILEWVAMPSSRGSFQPRDRTKFSHIASGFFTIWTTREAQDEAAEGGRSLDLTGHGRVLWFSSKGQSLVWCLI